MGISTSTGTLTAGQSRTFNLSPASAVTLTLPPNVRVTITETPATVAATGLGGNASRVHVPRLPGTFTYGPYPMGGSVVVDVDSNSGSSVSWLYTSATYSINESGDVAGLVDPDGTEAARLDSNAGDWMRQQGGVGQIASAMSTTVALTQAIPVASTRVRVAWQGRGSSGALAGTERLYIAANEDNAVAGLVASQDARRRLYTLAPGEAVVLKSKSPITVLHFSASASVSASTHSIQTTYEEAQA